VLAPPAPRPDPLAREGAPLPRITHRRLFVWVAAQLAAPAAPEGGRGLLLYVVSGAHTHIWEGWLALCSAGQHPYWHGMAGAGGTLPAPSHRRMSQLTACIGPHHHLTLRWHRRPLKLTAPAAGSRLGARSLLPPVHPGCSARTRAITPPSSTLPSAWPALLAGLAHMRQQ
jgi:hypothetical protein